MARFIHSLTALSAVAAFAGLSGFAPSVQADVLANYTFTGGSDTSSDLDASSTVSIISDLGQVGISGSTNTMFITSNNASTGNPGSSANNRGQFTLDAIGGFQIDLVNITGTVHADNGSNYEANWAVYVSTDGFTSETLAGVGTDPSGGGTTSFDISLASFQDVTDTLSFRLVPFFTTSSGEPKTSGKVLRIDNIVVNGVSEVVPEPSSLALISLGGLLCVQRRRRG